MDAPATFHGYLELFSANFNQLKITNKYRKRG